jgi:hypothetical protein
VGCLNVAYQGHFNQLLRLSAVLESIFQISMSVFTQNNAVQPWVSTNYSRGVSPKSYSLGHVGYIWKRGFEGKG